jgi:SNF2 family DNA or RNA helicase
MRHLATELRHYQRDKAIPFLKERPHVALFMDMGLGKTVSVLTAVSEMFRDGQLQPEDTVLVIAPLRVARGVWMQEARDWEHTQHLRVSRILGNERQRARAMRTRAHVHVINVENTQWLFRKALPQYVKKFGQFPYKMLVIDESSKFKHPNTERFKAIKPQLRHFQRKVLLSGTPAPQGLTNLWSQYYVLDEGARLGTAFDRYKFRFFVMVDAEGHKWEARAGALEYISDLVRDITIRMDAADYLELPELLVNPVWVDLPERPRALYNQFERELFLQLDTVTVEAFNAATLTGKCHQLANGAVYNDPEVRQDYTVFHDEKIDALEEVLDSEQSNVLVAYNFRHDLMRIQKMVHARFPERRFEVFTSKGSDKMQDEWNDRKIDIMALNAQGAAHGVNIQYGGCAIAQFSQTWVNENYTQLIKRLQRSGQESKVVRLHQILARDTVDEAIRTSNRRNQRTERQFLDSLNLHRAMRELLA